MDESVKTHKSNWTGPLYFLVRPHLLEVFVVVLTLLHHVSNKHRVLVDIVTCVVWCFHILLLLEWLAFIVLNGGG